MQTVNPTLLESRILSEFEAGERFKWGDYDEEEYEDLGDYDLREYDDEKRATKRI